MEELLLRAGPALYVVLALAAVWAVVSVLWTALSVARIRVPAPLWWLFPALTLSAGGVGALLGYARVEEALALLGASPRMELAGLAEAGLVLWMAAWVTAVGLVISTPFMAAANVMRAGEFGRWKFGHAVPGLVAAPLTMVGFASSIPTVVFGLVGAVSITLVAVRLGAGDDRRRMVAGRAFVGAISTLAVVCLGLAHLVGNRLRLLEVWSKASFDTRDGLVKAVEEALPFLIGGDLAVAGILALASLATLVPVARAVLDGRTSGGFLFSAFVAMVPALAVAPAVTPLLSFETFDEQAERQAALRRAGIELVEAEADAPWTPGTPVTVGVYWAHVADERTLPFKEGRVDEGDLDGSVAIPIASAIRGVRYDPVRIEIDRRADLHRLAPVFQALRQEGIEEACAVVRSKTGAFGCISVDLGAPSEEATHLLLRSIDTTLIDGEAEPEPIDLTDSAERLSALAAPIVIHPDASVSAQRLLEALARINASSEPPLLAVD